MTFLSFSLPPKHSIDWFDIDDENNEKKEKKWRQLSNNDDLSELLCTDLRREPFFFDMICEGIPSIF